MTKTQTRTNVKHRVVNSLEEGHNFLSSYFRFKQRCSKLPLNMLVIAVDLNIVLGESDSKDSYLIASTSYHERLWEPDESGHYMEDRPEKLSLSVILPKDKMTSKAGKD